jgi:hypothetical protein
MESIYKRYLLFLGLCIPIRLLIAYVSSIANKQLLFWMGLIALLPAVGFLSIYFFNLRQTGGEVFGEKIWWNSLRPVHAFNYLLFSYLAINNNKNSKCALYFDVLIGLCAFLYHHSNRK